MKLQLRDLVNAAEGENLRLRHQVEEYEVALAESRRESQSLRRDLEEAKLEQNRLEDELELRSQEIERMGVQIQESEKSRLESQKLAENEVFHDLSIILINL